ncbi:MAG: hypothetical protein JXA06_09615 [Bacteroidetes bacterium]|nr:hypothetical protein [Bacteroidota bacterium]
MALKHIDISSYLGYTVSAVTFIFGVIILSGLAFQYIPVEMRIMFGVVMVLMGIYRFVLTRTKIRQKSEGEEE